LEPDLVETSGGNIFLTVTLSVLEICALGSRNPRRFLLSPMHLFYYEILESFTYIREGKRR
jgi:hypothetical protein